MFFSTHINTLLMKKLSLLLLGAAACGIVSAAPRTVQQALALAKQQAATQGASIKMPKPANAASSAPGELQTVSPYYVFDKAEGGFVIVSGEDRLPAIVGYTDHGSFDAANMPDGLRFYLEAYAATVKSVAAGNTTYGESGDDEGVDYPNVAPLLGDVEWNQDAPYNLYCPVYEETDPETGEVVSGQYPTGCAATAAAQIMKYHQFPTHQPDLAGYTTKSGITIDPVAADDSPAGAYDYEHMLPKYYGNEDETENSAVAKLMAHIGQAMTMNYNVAGSAVNEDQVKAGFTTMGYDTTLLQMVYRFQFTRRGWLEVINNELRHARPIEYMGYVGLSGHAFVLDGCDGHGFYHINWGWGGMANGNFDIAVLDPGTTSGIGASPTSGGYNVMNIMILGITPDNADNEQPQVLDFDEMTNVSLIDVAITDADGGTQLFYNPDYTFINCLYATVTNNNDREVDDAVTLMGCSIDRTVGSVDPIEGCITAFGYDLRAHETGSYYFDFPTPSSWYDMAIVHVNYVNEELVNLFQFGMQEVDNPDPYFEIDTHAMETTAVEGDPFGLKERFVVNKDNNQISINVANAGGLYRGNDYVMGEYEKNLQPEVFEFQSGSTQLTHTLDLEPGEPATFVIACTNPKLSGDSNYPFTRSTMILAFVGFIGDDTVTGIAQTGLQDAASWTKRMVDGRLVIEQGGKSYDVLGRSK